MHSFLSFARYVTVIRNSIHKSLRNENHRKLWAEMFLFFYAACHDNLF
jgi:hypothetical protein